MTSLFAARSARFFVINAFDAGFGVGGIGFLGDLPVRCSFGFHADVFQCYRQRPMFTYSFVDRVTSIRADRDAPSFRAPTR